MKYIEDEFLSTHSRAAVLLLAMALTTPTYFENMFFCTVTYPSFSRPLANTTDDDVITIACPGEVDGDIVRKFTMKRSALQRSEPLNKFFQSRHYRFACGMTLHFTQIPGACFSVVKDYLEKGPDRCNKAEMRNELSQYYTDEGKRLEIYTRLYKCARQLELSGLKSMAWAAIKVEEGSMAVEHCVTLASFVFTDQAGYGHEIKGWLMGYIKQYFSILNDDPVVSIDPQMTWMDVVKTLSPGFKKEWKQLVKEQSSRLSNIEEEGEYKVDEKLLNKVLEDLDKADRARAESAKNGTPLRSAVTARLAEMDAAEEDDYIDEFDDLDHYCPGPEISRKTDDSKARAWLGAPPNPRFSHATNPGPRTSSLDLETAKARAVMGINSPSHGVIAGRRKQPALTRAAKSLSNLLR